MNIPNQYYADDGEDIPSQRYTSNSPGKDCKIRFTMMDKISQKSQNNIDQSSQFHSQMGDNLKKKQSYSVWSQATMCFGEKTTSLWSNIVEKREQKDSLISFSSYFKSPICNCGIGALLSSALLFVDN